MCHFIHEISAKKPANFEILVLRFRVNYVNSNICISCNVCVKCNLITAKRYFSWEKVVCPKKGTIW